MFWFLGEILLIYLGGNYSIKSSELPTESTDITDNSDNNCLHSSVSFLQGGRNKGLIKAFISETMKKTLIL